MTINEVPRTFLNKDGGKVELKGTTKGDTLSAWMGTQSRRGCHSQLMSDFFLDWLVEKIRPNVTSSP